MKKETQEQKIKRLIEANIGRTEVSHCNFVGVQFDEKATETISDIADGLCTNAEALKANAEALKALSEVLRSSNVTIEAMVKVN